MKKQINFGLVLGFLFVVWLFANTWVGSYHKEKSHKEKEAFSRYAVVKSEEITPIIYDKVTGETWRYFRNRDDKGKLKDEGWARLTYSGFDAGFDTATGNTPAEVKWAEGILIRKMMVGLKKPAEPHKKGLVKRILEEKAKKPKMSKLDWSSLGPESKEKDTKPKER